MLNFKFIISILFLSFFHLNLFAQIPSDIQKIISRGKLIVVIPKQDFPPFFFHDNKKKYEGFDIELAHKISSYLGVKTEFNSNATSFDDVITLMEKNKADIGIGAISATIERGLHVAFSKPYLKENKVFIVNRQINAKVENNDPSIEQKSLKFAVIKNSSYERSLQNKFYSISKFISPNQVDDSRSISEYLTKKQIVPYDSVENAMDDLVKGKIYAVFMDEIKADYLIKKMLSPNLFVTKHLIDGQVDPISIVVNHKNQNLLNWLNLFLDSIEFDGQKNTLSQKYFKGFK